MHYIINYCKQLNFFGGPLDNTLVSQNFKFTKEDLKNFQGSFTQCDLFVCDGDFLKYFLCDLRASVHMVHFCVNAFVKLEIFVLLWIVS